MSGLCRPQYIGWDGAYIIVIRGRFIHLVQPKFPIVIFRAGENIRQRSKIDIANYRS